MDEKNQATVATVEIFNANGDKTHHEASNGKPESVKKYPENQTVKKGIKTKSDEVVILKKDGKPVKVKVVKDAKIPGKVLKKSASPKGTVITKQTKDGKIVNVLDTSEKCVAYDIAPKEKVCLKHGKSGCEKFKYVYSQRKCLEEKTDVKQVKVGESKAYDRVITKQWAEYHDRQRDYNNKKLFNEKLYSELLKKRGILYADQREQHAVNWEESEENFEEEYHMQYYNYLQDKAQLEAKHRKIVRDVARLQNADIQTKYQAWLSKYHAENAEYHEDRRAYHREYNRQRALIANEYKPASWHKIVEVKLKEFDIKFYPARRKLYQTLIEKWNDKVKEESKIWAKWLAPITAARKAEYKKYYYGYSQRVAEHNKTYQNYYQNWYKDYKNRARLYSKRYHAAYHFERLAAIAKKAGKKPKVSVFKTRAQLQKEWKIEYTMLHNKLKTYRDNLNKLLAINNSKAHAKYQEDVEKLNDQTDDYNIKKHRAYTALMQKRNTEIHALNTETNKLRNEQIAIWNKEYRVIYQAKYAIYTQKLREHSLKFQANWRKTHADLYKRRGEWEQKRREQIKEAREK